MRIVGGDFGGRRLKVPRTDAVRPTQDSVREALFSMLGAAVAGADFLDLFAGSGAVGLEALSRGAKSATFVELDRRHLAVVRENAAALAVGRDARFVAAALPHPVSIRTAARTSASLFLIKTSQNVHKTLFLIQ